MKTHTKVYMKFFGYGEQDYIPCELTGLRASDIHHISPRGMGGSKEKDDISNLMALSREEHDKAEAQKYSESDLWDMHKVFINYFKTYDKIYANGILHLRWNFLDLYKELLNKKDVL